MRPYLLLPLFSLCFVFAACEKQPYDFYSGPGKKPVYVPFSALNDIRSEAPRPITLSGTIFLRDTLLFVLEQRQGIHVFNLADTANTVNVAFLKIPAATDFTVAGNRLYVDSWKDLVVIDISNLQQIEVVGRITDVLQPPLYPPLYDGIFECVDETKGAVIGWEDAQLENVHCVTTN